MSSNKKSKTTPPRRGTPPEEEGNQPALNSPPSEGWQAQPDGVVPKLRFPGFGELWKKSALDKLIDFQSGYAFQSEYFSDQGEKLLTPKNFTKNGYADFNKGNTKYTLEEFDPKYVCKEGDLLLLLTDLTPSCELLGKPLLLTKDDGDVLLNQRIVRIITKGSIKIEFLFYFFLTESFHKRITDTATGSTVRHSSNKIISSTEICFPLESEQQKIADCLSSIADRITAETQKLDTLKAHKKGLMQQLFPAEGETLPKLRFSQFRDAEKWEEKRIEDLAIRGSGHTPNKSQPSYYNGGIKWVSLADSNRLDNGYIYKTKIEISKEGVENSSAVLHPPGTVIISRDAGVGKSAVLYSAMAVSQHFIVWRCNKSKLSNWFLYFFLQVLKPKFEEIATGSTIKTIGLPYFKQICIPIPSIHEQQKIADCLSSLDELTTAQTQKIDTLKTHKKGLMQQLFPSVEEVKR
jgi:type I restriction enzyme, S subunit